MNQPDVLSQMQPEGEQNAEDQAGPEESAIPTDPSEGKWEQRVAPLSPFPGQRRWLSTRQQGWGLPGASVLRQPERPGR